MSQKRDSLPFQVLKEVRRRNTLSKLKRLAHPLSGSIYGKSEKFRILVLLWLGLQRPSRQTGRDPRSVGKTVGGTNPRVRSNPRQENRQENHRGASRLGRELEKMGKESLD
jgi:hypothetical protein